MALTLIEAAKLETGNDVRRAVIELYAGSSDILGVLPFQSISGNALKYNREDTLPGVGFRGVNEAYTESVGVLNPITETLSIAGGDLDFDKFLLQTMGMEQRSVQIAMKVKALGLCWTKKFLKGDTASDVREFDGLQTRLTGGQKIVAGTTSGGDALSLAKLDQAIDQVENPTHLIMDKRLARRFSAAARLYTVGGYVTYEPDEFGKRILKYNGLPILVTDLDESGSSILPCTEAAPTGGQAQTQSLYVVSFGDGKLVGIQNGAIDVRDLGELQTKPCLRTRVEWYSGIACFHGRAAARLYGITDAAIAA
jgi:hypothetical protein